jgi:putative DNA primase/helicase
MMLGRAGVIRLSPDEDVTTGLGITEGIEDGLRVLLAGGSPVWACGSAGGIDGFPVLLGIECLTVFADNDDAGIRAAKRCEQRWHDAGEECRVVTL